MIGDVRRIAVLTVLLVGPMVLAYRRRSPDQHPYSFDRLSTRYNRPMVPPIIAKKTFSSNLETGITSPPPHLGYGYGENGENNGWGWGDPRQPKLAQLAEAEGVVKFINQFLGVMGPFLFPLPYVLAMIPFAIPAIPLSLWLGSRPERNNEGEHSNGPKEPPSPMAMTTTTTAATTPMPLASTPTTTMKSSTGPNFHFNSSFITFPPFTFPPNNLPSNNNNATSGSGHGAVTRTPSPPHNSNSNNDTTMSTTGGGHNSTLVVPPLVLPPLNMSHLPPPSVTLFPYTIFLNDSFLDDFFANNNNEDQTSSGDNNDDDNSEERE